MKRISILMVMIMTGSIVCNAQWATSGTNISNTNTGNVGIGTTSPTQKLDVNGTIRATGFLLNTIPLVSSQWSTSGSNINFTTGIVSIGTTTSPSGYKLAIGGKIIAEEIVVKLQGNWPDYVFEPTYRLPSLSELEKFIILNKHLPGVPTAAEVENNGLSLGEMNAILLKKVEELTLLIIIQDKESQAILEQLKELQIQLNQLEKK